jgi:hypothetical protein
VHFRPSDVIAVGDVFNPDRIRSSIAHRRLGSGLIAALNHILEITVPARFQEGGHVRHPRPRTSCPTSRRVEYRDMVTIIRDRVQDLIGKGTDMEQVKAAQAVA